ncbi:MAG: hypothetical protein GF364_20755 [Candidatus Lokiarchaeota archaeon]|nr:hypothetical protein [Candidatus Lokiarchaeota archaeon]
MEKTKVYLATKVFREIADHPKVSEEKSNKIVELWKDLKETVDLHVSADRFPDKQYIEEEINNWGAEIIGCHLSHPITADMLKDSNVYAVCTSTAGYNHIFMQPDVLITHTPGVLHRTVADFTISVILANLRNLISLHNFVWDEKWKPGQKWDLDENLNSTIDNKVLGIIGLGEIGKEIVKRLAPWGIQIIYYDIEKQSDIESEYENLSYVGSLESIFMNSDIVSIHVPLLPATRHIIGEKYLRLMKENALLVNTARGPIIHTEKLLDLLEKKEISINLAFDVYENEPILEETLQRYKKIAEENPELRFIFIPHNASADADTRAEMAIMTLEDIMTLAKANSVEDLESLRLIPPQRYLYGGLDKKPDIENYRITKKW